MASNKLNTKVTEALWKMIVVEFPEKNAKGSPIKWFRPSVKLNPKHDFLGYAYIRLTLTIAPLIALVAKIPGSAKVVNYLKAFDQNVCRAFYLGLRNLELKILPKGFFVSLPEKYSDPAKGGDGEYYPDFMLLSGELRAVLTQRLLEHPDVKAAIAVAEKLHEAKKAKDSKSVSAGGSDELDPSDFENAAEGLEDLAVAGDDDENPFKDQD